MTFGIMAPLDLRRGVEGGPAGTRPPHGKMEKKLAMSSRALVDLGEWMESRHLESRGVL